MPPGLTVIADRAEISMMLANYLDNALTYACSPVEIQAAEREGCAEIRVTDHGAGVPASFSRTCSSVSPGRPRPSTEQKEPG